MKNKIFIIIFIVIILVANIFIYNSKVLKFKIFDDYRLNQEVDNYNTLRVLNGAKNEKLEVDVENIVKSNNKLEYTVVYKLDTDDEYLTDENLNVDFGITIFDSKNIIYINKSNALVNIGGHLDINYYAGILEEKNIKNKEALVDTAKEISKDINVEDKIIKITYELELTSDIDSEINIRIYNVNLYTSETIYSNNNENVPYMQYKESEWQFKKSL